jgi:hypothetical protein
LVCSMSHYGISGLAPDTVQRNIPTAHPTSAHVTSDCDL